MTSVEIIDLFSGAGGLSLGFKLEGFKILLSVEKEKIFHETYNLNNPDCICLNEDITNLDVKQTCLKYLPNSRVTGIIGGPPCQGYSSVGNRNRNDPRNTLVYYFIKWVETIKPWFFVMENVPGILTMDKGRVVQKIKQLYNDIGYECQMRLLKASDYGIPQVRKRVFFIGFKEKMSIPLYFRKERSNIFTVRDALSDILEIKPITGRSNGLITFNYDRPPQTPYQQYLRKNSVELRDHHAPNHGKNVKERISFIKPGENHQDLPKNYKLNSGYSNIYGRLHLNRPADTITANCGCVSAPGRFIHPTQNRAISVREAARLQSFPDTYSFKGGLNQKYKQIGNAVPPLLAKRVAKTIKKSLDILLAPEEKISIKNAIN
ncbi:MAG: DNA cytosine methyltransferase [Candidatus Lokiarchaeota archaeon]|nr:DNA cytosine methyltransferase [Candidatus Lokiarchaeota archaeon]